MNDHEIHARIAEIEADLDRQAEQGYCSYPAEFDVNERFNQVVVTLADDSVRRFKLRKVTR